MAAIFNGILVNKILCILMKISLKFFSKGPIDNKPALVQIMAWHPIGDKPLSEPMPSQFADANMQHYGEISWEDRSGVDFDKII